LGSASDGLTLAAVNATILTIVGAALSGYMIVIFQTLECPI